MLGAEVPVWVRGQGASWALALPKHPRCCQPGLGARRVSGAARTFKTKSISPGFGWGRGDPARHMGWDWRCRFPSGRAGRAAFLRPEQGGVAAPALLSLRAKTKRGLIRPRPAPISVQLQGSGSWKTIRAGTWLCGAAAGPWPRLAAGPGCCVEMPEGASSPLLPEPQTCPVPEGKINPPPLLELAPEALEPPMGSIPAAWARGGPAPLPPLWLGAFGMRGAPGRCRVSGPPAWLGRGLCIPAGPPP